MINSSSDNVKKLNSIRKNVYYRIIDFFHNDWYCSRLFFLQVKENKKYLTLSDKNKLENGNWLLSEVNFMIILEI